MKGDLFKLVLAFALILFIPSVFSVPVFDFNWFSSDLNDYVLGHPSAFTVYEDYWLSYGSGGDVIQAMRRVPIEKSDPRTHDFNLSFEFLAYSTTYDDFRIFLSLSNGGICSAPNKITGASCDDYNSTHKECSIGSYSPSQIYFPKNEWHKMLFSWDLNEELGLGFWKIEMYDMNGVQIANASTGYQNPNSWGYYDEVISFTMYADWWNWCAQAGNNNFKVRKVHWTSKKAGNQNNLVILSPQYGEYFTQDEEMNIQFQVTDKNDFYRIIDFAEYKVHALDQWAPINLSGYGFYQFNTIAPNTIGEYELQVRAWVDGNWVTDTTKYNIQPKGIDLNINFIKAVQVIEDVDLVAGKATAVKVGVTNENNTNQPLNITVRLEFNDKNFLETKTFVGDSNYTFYVDNPYEEEGTYSIIAEIDPLINGKDKYEESDEDNIISSDVTVFKVKPLIIKFRSIDIDKNEFSYTKNGENYYINNRDLFDNFAELHASFIRATFPVADVSIKKNNKVYCPIFSDSCTNANYNFFPNQIIFLDFISLSTDEFLNDPELVTFGGNIKKVIGLTGNRWFNSHGFTDTGGYSKFSSSLPVFVELFLMTISAHETSHTLGLCDEYFDNSQKLIFGCPNEPPEGCGSRCYGALSDQGIWVDPNINRLIKGLYQMEIKNVDNDINNTNNFFNYMGSSDIFFGPTGEFRRWTDKILYNHLIEQFQTNENKSGQEDLNVLLVTGVIDQNFDVNLSEWFVVQGTEFGSEDGNCVIRTLDSNNNTLNDYNFSVMFEKYPGSDFNYSPLFMGIGFNQNIHKIQVLCHNQNIAERTVSANAPEIEITSPSGSEQWSGVNSVTWNASDADGDPLFFVLKYSDDNGTIWNSLDYNVTDTNYLFDVGMVDGNTSYKIKVIATDGILTGNDVSETFSILNPDITIELNEWNLETINNLQNVSQDFNIVNTGNADLNVFDMNVSDNLTVTGLVLPLVLQPGEKQAFSVELNVLDMNLGEFVEDINLGSNDPNQIIKRIKVYGEIEQAKPDFRITEDNISFNPVYPDENQNVTVNALVENLGDLNAENVSVKFYSNQVSAYPLDYSTVALYHADSNSGITLIDATGNHDGSFKGTGEPAWTENSKFGVSALSFDGTNDYVSVPDHNELDLTDEISVEFWFYSNGWSDWDGLLAKRNYGGNEATNYGLNTNSSIFQWYFREAGGSWRILSFSTPTANEWHHFMGTFKQINPTTVEATAYIDGILQGDLNLSGNLSNTINSHDVIIGSSAVGYQPFNGLIDEIRISNKIREPFELVLDEKNISFIDANSSELVSADWNSVPVGDYKVFVVVDEENSFDEKDETNNQDFNSITVYSEPELSINFEYSPLQDLGELFDLNAIITNEGATLKNANAELILSAELTTADLLTKNFDDLSSHTSTKIEWTDINSSQAGLFEIIVNVKGDNVDENFSAFTAIRHIEVSELDVNQFVYPDQNIIGDFNVINFNPKITYSEFYYNVNITGPENYFFDENTGSLYAGQTKNFIIEWSNWKQTGNYNITISLYDYYDKLVAQKQDSFEVIPYKSSMLTYYSTDGLTFNPEFSSYSDYFSSAADKSNQVMVVYSYENDLNYSIRNPVAQEWSAPQTIGNGNYPYLVADGNSFHLVYVDENVYYRKYSDEWSSAELVSELNSVDPVLTFDGSYLYALFSSQVNGLFNVYLVGFDGHWNKEMGITHCFDANCSNPIALDEGLVNGKLGYAYRKFKGAEYSSLDSNLMFSLFDLNYFYWGNN